MLSTVDAATTGQNIFISGTATIQANSRIQLQAADELHVRPNSVLTATGPFGSVTLSSSDTSVDDAGSILSIGGDVSASQGITVRGGAQDDSILLDDEGSTQFDGGTVYNLSASNVSVDGGDGLDTFTLDDSGDVNADDVSVANDRISGLIDNGTVVQLASIESLDISLGDGNDKINSSQVATGIESLRIRGGDGADEFIVPIHEQVPIIILGESPNEAAGDVLHFASNENPFDTSLFENQNSGLNVSWSGIEELSSDGDGGDGGNGGEGSGDEVIIQGTTGNDNIIISSGGGSRLLVRIDGVFSTIEATGRIVIQGLAGNDRIAIAGNVSHDFEIEGGAGRDRIAGSIGNDIIDGGDGNDTILTGGGDNSAMGGQGNDVIAGRNGDDVLDGGMGNDELNASSGNDKLSGGDGNDKLTGGTGDDLLDGGNGNDILVGQQGNDILIGGGGDDWLRGWDGRDLLIGGANQDALWADGHDDILIGGNSVYDEDIDMLQEILTAWSSTDSFETRIETIRNSSFIATLTSQQIVGDEEVDFLTGGASSDWFLPDAEDEVSDKSTSDFLND